MKKNIRIAAKAALSLLILLVLGYIGLVIYAKYFYNRDVKVVSYYADELCLRKEAFKAEFEEIYQVAYSGGYPFSISGDIRSVPS